MSWSRLPSGVRGSLAVCERRGAQRAALLPGRFAGRFVRKPLDGSVFRFLPLCWSYAPEKTLPASFLQGVGLAGGTPGGRRGRLHSGSDCWRVLCFRQLPLPSPGLVSPRLLSFLENKYLVFCLMREGKPLPLWSGEESGLSVSFSSTSAVHNPTFTPTSKGP